MAESIKIGHHVKIYLDSRFRENEGWYEGIVVRIDPYSKHRSFYWVELDTDSQAKLGIKEISVFNPRNIKKIGQ